MTSHSHVGNIRPPLGNTSSSISRPLSPVPTQIFNPPHRSVPQHALADHSSAAFSHNLFEPPSKKQKLDLGYESTIGQIGLQQGYENSPSPIRQTPQTQITKTRAPTQVAPSSSVAKGLQVPCFPIRPKNLAGWKAGVCPVQPKAVPKESVQAKPYQLEVPRIAPQYGTNSAPIYYSDSPLSCVPAPADFFPWVGHHPEDILNEHSTRNGYYEKVISQTETNTARSSVWSGFKHKSGLQILSSLFVSVLDQRQAHGTVIAKCTFKPPPRVTLTDAKREAWLRDLANSTIPLRRLSRTIPHGIRGKNLLDHCLAKKIPTWRAVWLAKCVGANEIRAFKRKGTSGAFSIGGESKWIKDWTSNVEQFTEALVASCNSPDWRNEITYGLQLVAHIVAEHLLDPEHFFDWLITALDSSQHDMLPAWLLVVEAHLTEIKRFRFRCRRLIESLLNQSQQITTPCRKQANLALQNNITAFIMSLSSDHPICCVLPHYWLKYESIPQLCFKEQDPALNYYLRHLRERNLLLYRPPCANIIQSYQTPRQKFIALLDALGTDFDIGDLSKSAVKILDNPNVLISTLIEWSTTCYRAGQSRIYIALGLLRQLSKAGWSLDQPVLQLISYLSKVPGLHRPSMYKLFAELVRSKLLAVGKYLQWLIARGPPPTLLGTKTADVFELQLLENIPLHDLPPYVLNLRRILMKAGGLSVSTPHETEESIKFTITGQLSFLRREGFLSEPRYRFTNLTPLSGTTKYGISRWIRDEVASEFQDSGKAEADGTGDNLKASFMTLDDFQIVRELLETLEDYPILADVLSIILASCPKPLLEAIAETANCHVDIFHALGAAENLFDKILARMEVLYFCGPTDKPILISLLDLGEHLPHAKPTLRMLQQELRLCQPNTAVAGCSPVSDHMVEALHSSDATFIEDTEALFSSGTSMDVQIVTQVFSEVTKRLHIALHHNGHYQCFIDLLTQLRPFDKQHFDALMLDWLDFLLWSSDDSRLLYIIIPLICARLLGLRRLLQSMVTRLGEAESHDACLAIAMQIIVILMTESPERWLVNPQRAYRFHRERAELVRDNPNVVLAIIQHSLRACLHKDLTIRQSAERLTSNPRYLQLLRAVLLHYEPAVLELGQSFRFLGLHEQANKVLSHLLRVGSQDDLSLLNSDGELRNLLHLIDDFNLEVCQLRLYILLSQSHDGSLDTDTTNKGIEILVDEAGLSFRSSPGIWARVISIIPRGYAEMFRNSCVLRLFKAMPDWSTEPHANSPMPDERGTCEGLLASIDVAESKIPRDAGPGVILEILKLIVSVRTVPLLAKLQTDSALDEDFNGSSEAQHEQNICYTCMWLDILLRLLIIHQDTIAYPKFPQQMLCHLLLSLGLLLINPNLGPHGTFSTRLFDLVAFFSDNLTPESRISCAAILRDQHHLRDPRLQYIFGVVDIDEGELLIIRSKTQPSLLHSRDASIRVPFIPRRWEMVQDATPMIGENDTSLSLNLFGTRKAVL